MLLFPTRQRLLISRVRRHKAQGGRAFPVSLAVEGKGGNQEAKKWGKKSLKGRYANVLYKSSAACCHDHVYI